LKPTQPAIHGILERGKIANLIEFVRREDMNMNTMARISVIVPRLD
jgi:hypothetical protein